MDCECLTLFLICGFFWRDRGTGLCSMARGGGLGFSKCGRCGEYVWMLRDGHRVDGQFMCRVDGCVSCPFCLGRFIRLEELNGHIFFQHGNYYGRWYRLFGAGLRWLNWNGLLMVI